jgi:hypothetical protein
MLAAVPDCERISEGLLAQPTNAVSSLVFLLAGAWVVGQARRSRAHRRELLVFGAAIASNAVGGLLYHGDLDPATRAVHDVAIVAVLAFIAVFDVARLTDRGWPWTWRAFAASLGLLAAAIVVLPGAQYVVFGVVGAVIVGAEIADYVRERPKLRGIAKRRLARLGAVLSLGLAATAFFVGRSGAPLCRPESAMQWHAIWHALAAVTMALYAYSAVEEHPPRPGVAPTAGPGPPAPSRRPA